MPSDSFLDHVTHIGQLFPIGRRWQSRFAEQLIYLGLSFALNIREQHHCQKKVL